ncbi:glycosyltransferase [Hungatella hathewayi]|uniref:Glycosyltransferase n=2 Tax=Lachnospiraceae TaxID=186803 RepID=A0AAW9WK63_9FIRM|nr:glycosyltransferase [Hungatella hathewayi]
MGIEAKVMDSMKVLFISEYLVNEEISGGSVASKNHLESIRELVGYDNVDVVAPLWKREWEELNRDRKIQCVSAYKNHMEQLINNLEGNVTLLNHSIIREIVRKIEEQSYDVVFLDNTFYGTLIRRIKKKFPSVKIIVFFHGVNRKTWELKLKADWGKLRNITQFLAVFRNERIGLKYTDINLMLNQRDNELLYQYYGVRSQYFLPSYYSDTAIDLQAELPLDHEFRLLFVGGYFWPNVAGITWFVKNVLNFLTGDIHLYIVGYRMEELREREPFAGNSRVTVIGTADSLDAWYNSADLVVSPIFEGDGMKTKTAEALMYGKIILGTGEAFCGYVGLEPYQCDTKEAFIRQIQAYQQAGISRYHQNIRDIFTERYSQEAARRTFREILFEEET